MKNFWQEDDETYKLVPLTAKIIESAEEKLQVKFPKSYIKLLKKQNGGYIYYNAFPCDVPTSWADDHINVDHILGIGEEEGVVKSEYLINEWGLPKNIVVFSGDGHTWIAFDYRKKKSEPPIIYVDVEADQIIELASDFESFLEGLYVNETELEDEVELDDTDYEQGKRNWSLDDLKSALSTTNQREIIPALNYLSENRKGNETFIEQSMIELLQSPVLEIKEVAANYANEFYKRGVFSSEGVKEMISIIKRDNEIAYYVEMFFRQKR
ncbi:SMI1/KNR4 family protein [Metaplanococcus flavidus]|uniref:SMI1/KNR4 family protein n=1 Tax=Metaplanococcus flavidus TaxID=569883 RepID=A0ABW3L8Y7_9BACL